MTFPLVVCRAFNSYEAVNDSSLQKASLFPEARENLGPHPNVSVFNRFNLQTKDFKCAFSKRFLSTGMSFSSFLLFTRNQLKTTESASLKELVQYCNFTVLENCQLRSLTRGRKARPC